MRLAPIAFVILALALPAAAQDAAEPTANELGNCLTMKSTGADRLDFARWMVASLGSAPQIKDIATVSPDSKEKMDRKMAATFTRLVMGDCGEISRGLIKSRSPDAFRAAGEAFGKMAMQELLGNREAAAGLEAFTKYIDPLAFLPPQGK